MNACLKRVSLASVFFMAVLLSADCWAASQPGEKLVQAVLDCEAQAYVSLADYQHAALVPADASLRTPLDTDFAAVQRCAAAALPAALTLNGQANNASRLQQAAGDTLQAFSSARGELEARRSPTPAARKLLQQRYHELAVALDTAETLLVSSGRVDPLQDGYLTHKVAQDLRHLEALYFARAGSSNKQAVQVEMASVVEQVDSMMDSLQAQAAAHRELDKSWRAIQATWQFERRAAMDANLRSTGFLVASEADRLVSLLQQFHV